MSTLNTWHSYEQDRKEIGRRLRRPNSETTGPGAGPRSITVVERDKIIQKTIIILYEKKYLLCNFHRNLNAHLSYHAIFRRTSLKSERNLWGTRFSHISRKVQISWFASTPGFNTFLLPVNVSIKNPARFVKQIINTYIVYEPLYSLST
jgi:hypothetical protein